MLLTRNSGCKDKGFVLIDKDFRFFFIIIGMFGAFHSVRLFFSD